MKKNLLLFVLIMLPLLAHADDSGSCGENVTYTYKSSTHTMTISGNGLMTDYGVSSTNAQPWKGYIADIRKLVVENGVTNVSSYSFHDATALMSVTLPEGITSIGRWAFQGCSAITKMTLPNTVTIINDGAFWGCSSMKTINIPDGITEIRKEAFYFCSNLTSIDIPGSVKSIGGWAFYNCDKMTSVTLYEGLEFIGENAFMSCESLKSIVIPNSVTSIEQYSFAFCKGLESVILSDNLTAIGKDAFLWCSALQEIVIPATVEVIYSEAFKNSGLKKIKVLAVEPPIAFDDAFSNYNIPLYVPDESLSKYQTTEPWNKFITIKKLSEEGQTDIDPALQESREALNTSITEATAYYNNIKDNYSEIAATLKTAIDAAQTVADKADATKTEVDNAKTTLDTALQTAKDAKAAADKLAANKAAFEAYKAEQKTAADNKAHSGDSQACLDLISVAKTAIDNLPYDESKSLEQNKAAVDAILTKLEADLAAQREVDAAQQSLQVSKEALKNSITDATTYYNSIKDNYAEIAATLKTAIDAAQAVADKADATKTEVDNAKTTLDTALQTAKDAKAAADKLAANKAAFEAYKTEQKTAADNKAQSGDSQACQDLISAAKTAIDNLAYDESKSLDQNKAAVDAILKKLETDLAAQREADAAQKALQESLAALKKSIVDATAYYNSIKDNYSEIAAMLKAAIDTAQAIYDNNSSTKSEIDVAKTTLDAAVDAAKSIVTGISVIPSGDSLKTVYSLDGRKMGGTPTKKGIYIINGRKVIMN